MIDTTDLISYPGVPVGEAVAVEIFIVAESLPVSLESLLGAFAALPLNEQKRHLVVDIVAAVSDQHVTVRRDQIIPDGVCIPSPLEHLLPVRFPDNNCVVRRNKIFAGEIFPVAAVVCVGAAVSVDNRRRSLRWVIDIALDDNSKPPEFNPWVRDLVLPAGRFPHIKKRLLDPIPLCKNRLFREIKVGKNHACRDISFCKIMRDITSPDNNHIHAASASAAVAAELIAGLQKFAGILANLNHCCTPRRSGWSGMNSGIE